MPWDKGIAGAVFHSGQALVISDVKQDPRHFPGIDALTGTVTRDVIALPLPGARDLIALPVKRWGGDSIGVLEILNKREGLLDEDDLALLVIVSAIAATAIERARLYQQTKLAEMASLLGVINHDIKNLLMPVSTGAGLLDDEIKDLFGSLAEPEKKKAEPSYRMCKEVITMFGNSTRRVHDRVKEIADCVRGMSTAPVFAPCRLAAVMKDVYKALSWFADQKGLTLKSEGLDSLPEIMADERRLFNAFYNLINNAIPEVPAGGSVSVFGREDPPGVGILVAVADTGRGMPPEIVDNLFTTRARSRKAGGTGLGTKIVKDVVDAHRGRISVESQLGTGTTFYVFLPVTQPSA